MCKKIDFLRQGDAFFSYDVPLFHNRVTNSGHVFLVVFATDDEIGIVDVTTSKRLSDRNYYAYTQCALPHNFELARFDRDCKPFAKEVFIETSTFRVVSKRALMSLRIWPLNGNNGLMDRDVLDIIKRDIEECCEYAYRGLSSRDLRRIGGVA